MKKNAIFSRQKNGAESTAVTATAVGGKAFTATLYQNKAAATFKKLLPLSLKMDDQNSCEKYFNLNAVLQNANVEIPVTINCGDIMCYTSNQLMVFYRTIKNPGCNYVRLAKIDNPQGLATACSSGRALISFEVGK